MVRIALIVLALIAGTLFLGAYLSPNDLRACSSTPTNDSIVCEKVDAVVAISGGDTQGRARSAIDLYEKGWANRIVFSGAAADKSGPSNAAVMRDMAIESGVPPEVILTDDYSNNTRENADQTVALMHANGIDSIILTTSPYHQRRASLEFERAASEEMRVINHPSEDDSHWPSFWWITPNGWRLAGGELGRIISIYTGIAS